MSPWRSVRLWCCMVLAAACANAPPLAAPDYVALVPAIELFGSRAAFDRWLRADAARAQSFARFEEALAREGVSNVVPNYQLWRVDQIDPSCATAAFIEPPEWDWSHITATLRILRDRVVPAVGQLNVESGYRDPAFNTCIRGARRSAHVGFGALDLTPVDPAVTRERLIAALCAIHEREGARLRFGLGIYGGRRFHVDARAYRGWGSDYRGTTFPCMAEPSRRA